MAKLKMTPNEIKKLIQIRLKEWQNLDTTNCYAYALGLDIDLIKNIEKDLKTLGISYREIELNSKIETDEWKIAVFVGVFLMILKIYLYLIFIF